MFKKTLSTCILLGVCCAPLAMTAQQDEHHDAQQREHHDAQQREDHDQQQYVRHQDWKRGYHMNHDDWDRGQRVEDWRAHHLRQPRDGYEWREIDGNYVMADRDGVVSTVVVHHDRH